MTMENWISIFIVERHIVQATMSIWKGAINIVIYMAFLAIVIGLCPSSSVDSKLFYLNISSPLKPRSLAFDQTSQEWSLGGLLPKLFKLFQLVA